MKSIAHDDKLAMMLPPGESGVKKGVGVSGGWAWNNSLQPFNIFFKFVFTIPDVCAHFTELMEYPEEGGPVISEASLIEIFPS